VLERIPGVVPPTRALAKVARGVAVPMLAYRTLPSSLPFYAGLDVPTVDLPRGTAFDPPEIRQRWAPATGGALREGLAGGGVVLTRVRDEPTARAAVGRSMQPLASQGDLVLLHVEAAAVTAR